MTNISDIKLSHSASAAKASKSSGSSAAAILLLLFIISSAAFGWSFYKYNQTKKQLAAVSSIEGQKEVAKKEVNALLAKVRKHMVLPDNEEPVVATVTDKEALAKEQPFYQNAHNGDRVIAYMTARKAIIYDPIQDLIVNAGPIYVDSSAQKQQLQNNNANQPTPSGQQTTPQSYQSPATTTNQ